jgi:hypothetical protein
MKPTNVLVNPAIGQVRHMGFGIDAPSARAPRSRTSLHRRLPPVARTEPALSDAALNALEDIDQPRANAIATAAAVPQNGSDPMRSGHGAATLDPPQMTQSRRGARKRGAVQQSVIGWRNGNRPPSDADRCRQCISAHLQRRRLEVRARSRYNLCA